MPDDVHRAGPTYGGKNSAEVVKSDSGDLAGAASRDADVMVDNAKKMDPENVKVYEEAGDKIKQKDNAAYDDWLNDRLD